MQRILTAKQMGEIDRRTVERCGIPSLILMENASNRVVDFLLEKFAPLEAQRLLVLCGKGANGGDGLAVARHLLVRRLTADLEVALFAKPEDLRGDAKANFEMLAGIGCKPRILTDFASWRDLRRKTLPATVVVDAMLGTGLDGPIRGLPGEIVRDLNENFRHARFVAVDVPSGLPSDTGEPAGESAPADFTVTFTAPKIAQVFPPNCERIGELRISSIGTPDALLAEAPGPRLWLSEPGDFSELLADRDPSSHKGTFGHVAVIGGSRAKPGSILMTATAVLRSGAGLATVVTARGACGVIVGRTPELMTVPVDELEDGSIGEAAYSGEWLKDRDVVVIGPGIGVRPENQALVRRVVAQTATPLVADADGLTALAAGGEEVWSQRPEPLILTPHPGEMARLTGRPINEIQRDRVGAAREFAQRRGVILVLKGSRSLIASPDGDVRVNPTGTPGMATGGTGDILTGMIAGLLAQFPGQPPELVVAAAVYLHGLAGRLAAERYGEKPMLAMDLLEALPEAIRRSR